MSEDDETFHTLEKPVFGKNGEVRNREAFRPWSQPTAKPPPRDTLRVATPAYHRIWLAWLIAGLLNPTLFIWSIFFVIADDPSLWGLFWLVSLPSAIAAGLGIAFARGRNAYSFGYLLKLSLKMWGLVSGIAIGLPSLMALQASPYIIFFGGMTAITFGLPSAVAGAVVARIIIFRRKPVVPSIQSSTVTLEL